MSQPDPSGAPRHNAQVTAALLIVGLLILIPSGLCTSLFGGSALIDMLSHPRGEDYASGILLTAFIVGTPFIAIGGALLWLVVERIREKARGAKSYESAFRLIRL